MADTKQCRVCAEEIPARAKVCPRCRRHQSPLTLTAFVLGGCLLGLVVMLLFTAAARALLKPKSLLETGASFRAHAQEIVVRESSVHFADCKGKSQVSTVGILENHGPVGWKNLYLEVRYFDADGNLIDAESSKEYSMILLPGGEAAFRLQGSAAQSPDRYARHEVVVKHAEDLAAWP